MGKVARQYVNSFTHPAAFKRALIGQTGTRRLQQLALLTKELPLALADTDNPDGLFDDNEQLDEIARENVPWHIGESTRPYIPEGRIDPRLAEYGMAKMGRHWTHTLRQLPMTGPTDALEMWLTLGAGLM